MPPFVSRKRSRSRSPIPTSASKRSKTTAKKPKPALFEALDAPSQKPKSIEETKHLLDSLNDDNSSLSDVDSDSFEDVDISFSKLGGRQQEEEATDDPDDQDEDDMDWEDAILDQPSSALASHNPEIGDISVSINDDGSYIQPMVSAAISKKGPSKRDRQIRIETHRLHVLTLMWHNTVRNSWLNDKQVQQALLAGLNEGVKREITRWKEAMGTLSKEELDERKKQAAKKNKGQRRSKGKQNVERDWAATAEHLEQGVPNLSHGDPLLRLLKVIAAYWRKRFSITAPGLRKQGYKQLSRLRDEVRAWNKDRHDHESHGERIESVEHFRELARKCEGSRDVGAQLFVALLRAIGVETRLVASLQPAGFGWSKGEEADPKKPKKENQSNPANIRSTSDGLERKIPKKPNHKSKPITLDSDSSLSSAPSDLDETKQEDDDLSVIELSPPSKKPIKKYDRDLAFPTYWAEVCSPVSHKVIPIDPIVLSTIASNDELLQTFEPRGKKADRAKQVMCYTVAFSADGTAKDCTVRYLKKHQLPGKTKGVRFPVEKVPVYDHRGKVKKYEEYDWFRTVMSLYDRPEQKRTAVDDLEDQTDLKPYQPAKEKKGVEKESLQWYKQSAEFVLEFHLRREEAIKPGARPVKTFTAGQGDKAKEHTVFRRQDVATCKTVESWHKSGRDIQVGEQPIKYVPMRAVTLVRKREMEDAERETGEKLKQGLYSEDQTDWIIPPPIENGMIPKNAFGNMDVYTPTMVPQGAIHLPLKGTAKICRKLNIDYAEACTGFEFGKQRAVPVLTGVVVAEENAELVKEAWAAEQKEIKRKEDTKRTAMALHWWRKMVFGLRIIERMKAEYEGGGEDEFNPFVSKAHREGRSLGKEDKGGDSDGGGGFLLPGEEEVVVARSANFSDMLKGEADADAMHGGGFLVEEQESDGESDGPPTSNAPITPISLQSVHKANSTRGEKSKPGGHQRRSSNQDTESSSLSALSEPSDEESTENESDKSTTSSRSTPKSPQVVLPAQNSMRAPGQRTRNARKVAQVKSKYFTEDGEDGDDGHESEVVRPRQTTARTRNRVKS